jgi:hypothetical protein
LDTACTLAWLQEEATTSRRRECIQAEATCSYYPIAVASTASWDKSLGGKGVEAKKVTDVVRSSPVDSKVAALHAYRRAKGLCQYCAEKYFRGHKCAPTVQLQVVQELWDMLQSEVDTADATELSEPEAELNYLLSQDAVTIGGTSKSLKCVASIQGTEVLVLVDSGSSHSFVNVKLLPLLSGVSELASPVTVQVANGQVVRCVQVFNQIAWSIQEVQFVSNFKVLPLPYYDVILGMDWLELHSPMHVDWLNKWMTITIAGKQVQLQGLQPSLPTQSVLELCLVDAAATEGDHNCWTQQDLPAPIQQLLASFDQLFQEPQELPPSRSCDHSIPLIPSAQPVNVRPYRFSPAMKDEVETQVQDMLQQGIIQPSRSAFSSPVQLVKKKDNT